VPDVDEDELEDADVELQVEEEEEVVEDEEEEVEEEEDGVNEDASLVKTRSGLGREGTLIMEGDVDVDGRGEGAEGACMAMSEDEIKAFVSPATDADLFMPGRSEEKGRRRRKKKRTMLVEPA